jgi:hypothetical protein
MTRRLSTALALAIPVWQHQRFDRVGRDFRYWHRTDMPTLLSDVRCWANSGKHLLAASISPFDPDSDITGVVAPPQCGLGLGRFLFSASGYTDTVRARSVNHKAVWRGRPR